MRSFGPRVARHRWQIASKLLDVLATSGEITRAGQPRGNWTWRSHGLRLPAGSAQALLDVP